MSGGHFDYRQYQIEIIAEEIEDLVKNNDDKTLDAWGICKGYGFSKETIEKFKEAAHTLRQAAEMAQRVYWLVSADDSEDTFMERWNGEVRPYWSNLKKSLDKD